MEVSETCILENLLIGKFQNDWGTTGAGTASCFSGRITAETYQHSLSNHNLNQRKAGDLDR